VVLPWEQLRLVLAVGRHGTLSGAARALGMAPGELEQELKGVERAAGAALFVREDGRIFPTDAGRSALHTGERMSEEMARVERALPRVPPGPPVRVRVEEPLAARWLESAAAELARGLGSVTLEIVTGRGRGSTPDLEVTTRRAGEDPRPLGVLADALYASEAYLLDHGRPSSAERLVGHRVVLPIGSLARTDAGRWLLAASRAGAQVALRADSMAVLLAGVHAGVGLGVLPRGSEELSPELVQVSALPEIPLRPLWLVFGGEGRRSPRVRRAAQALEQTLSAALRRWERSR
jgi:DNA-binding transcriptional LysR family regulator